MKLYSLSLTQGAFLKKLRTLAKTPTVEILQQNEKESAFYLNLSENTFDLYERPAFSKGRSFSLGGMYLRGAAVAKDDTSCHVATATAKFPENIRNVILALFFLAVSTVMTVLSGNLFATMFPLLGAICLGYLIADLVASLVQKKRLSKHWAFILRSLIAEEAP